MTEKNYPLFVPPEHLAVKGRRDWTRKEADEYFEWQLGEIPTRVDALLCFLGLSGRKPDRELLHEAGVRVVEFIFQPQFSIGREDGSRGLTDAGLAISADTGLLVAGMILSEAKGRVGWTVVRKPKSDASYNLPVLIGFRHGIALDPVGGSIAETWGILRGNKGPEVWVEILDYWLANIEET